MACKSVCPISTKIGILPSIIHVYDATASSGPWPLLNGASILLYLQFLSSTSCSMCQKFCPFSYTQATFYLSDTSDPSLRFCRHNCFMGWGSFYAQPQTGGPGYPLSGSSPLTCLAWEALPVAYATASIALRIIWSHKPPPLRQSRDTFGVRKLECVHKF